MYTDAKLTAFTSQCNAPTVTVANNNTTTATVIIVNNETGATVYYTTDGSIPSKTSQVYSGPIPIRSSTIFRAQAMKSNSYNSKVILRRVTIMTSNEINIAPTGKAYSWNNDYLTADLSNANSVALPALNDNDSVIDVKLSTASRTAYTDADASFKYAKWQGGGIVWADAKEKITRFEYVQGTVSNDWWGGHGCYMWNIKLELTFDGTTWVNADKWGYMGEFPFCSFYGPGKAGGTGADDFPSTQFVPSKYLPVTFFLDKPTTIKGFRIMGGFNVKTANEQPNYVNVRELRAFQNSSLTTGLANDRLGAKSLNEANRNSKKEMFGIDGRRLSTNRTRSSRGVCIIQNGKVGSVKVQISETR